MEDSEKVLRDQEAQESKWVMIKYRLSIAAVIGVLVLLGLMMVDGSVMNFQCSIYDFLSFECNRWDTEFKPWK